MERKDKQFCLLVLAAGKGTRMRSKTPKVLQTILEEPLLYYPLSASIDAGITNISVMVGFEGEKVQSWLDGSFPSVKVLWQREQLGTGHAAKLAMSWWREYQNVMVLAGDTPLITAQTLKFFAEHHLDSGNKCTLLSFDLPDPTGYGRVIRDGASVRIVEHKDANDMELMSHEVNSGMYIFDTKALLSVIDKISCDNAQHEYYLPDAFSLIAANNEKVSAVKIENSNEFLGVNDPVQLADASVIMRNRILNSWMLRGVRCMDPCSTWIGPRVTIGEDTMLEPNVQMWGSTRVGGDCRVGSFTVLNNAVLADSVTIAGYVRVNNSTVGAGSSVGPFVFMRENVVLMDDVHVGRFVKIKKSTVDSGSKVPHLSYIGDASIGKKTNVGAGTITCNYDGKDKHKTIIGDNCFIGSDTMLVAPVTLGDNAMTAAGSTITNDIPDGGLGVGRARQVIIDNWHARRNKIKGGK